MYVSVGGPIFIIAVGAILRYATNFDISGIDMDVVGLILIIAGVAALILSIGLALFNRDDQVNRSSGGPPQNPPQR